MSKPSGKKRKICNKGEKSVKSVVKLTLKEVELIQGMGGFQNFCRKL